MNVNKARDVCQDRSSVVSSRRDVLKTEILFMYVLRQVETVIKKKL